MRLFGKLKPEWMLRLGLGLTFVYSGFDIWRHPTAWRWAIQPLPQFLRELISQIGVERYLRVQAAAELAFAFVFFAWFLPRRFLRVATFLTVVEMAAILWLVGIRGDTFRDIGLLGAALALLAFSYR